MIVPLIPVILVCGAWCEVTGLLIAKDLERRGFSIDFFTLRVKMPWYLGQYRKVTLEETGSVGSLFYHYVIPLWIAVMLTIIQLISILG